MLSAIEKQPAPIYHARRVALAASFTAASRFCSRRRSRQLDFSPYRQDEDFYYLTGWNEPGAALLIVAEPESAPPALDLNATREPRHYTEILFLPTRNLRQEKYTGVKVDAATPGAAQKAGVDDVKAMTDLPRALNDLIAADRRLTARILGVPAIDADRGPDAIHRRHPGRESRTVDPRCAPIRRRNCAW